MNRRGQYSVDEMKTLDLVALDNAYQAAKMNVDRADKQVKHAKSISVGSMSALDSVEPRVYVNQLKEVLLARTGNVRKYGKPHQT